MMDRQNRINELLTHSRVVIVKQEALNRLTPEMLFAYLKKSGWVVTGGDKKAFLMKSATDDEYYVPRILMDYGGYSLLVQQILQKLSEEQSMNQIEVFMVIEDHWNEAGK